MNMYNQSFQSGSFANRFPTAAGSSMLNRQSRSTSAFQPAGNVQSSYGQAGSPAGFGMTAGMAGGQAGYGMSATNGNYSYRTANYRGDMPGHDAYLRSDSQSPNESAYQSQGQGVTGAANAGMGAQFGSAAGSGSFGRAAGMTSLGASGMSTMGGTNAGMTSGMTAGRARVPGYNSFGIPVGTSGAPMSSANGPGSALGSGGMSSLGGTTAGMSSMGRSMGMSAMDGTTAGMSSMGRSMGTSAMDGTTGGMSSMGRSMGTSAMDGTTAGMSGMGSSMGMTGMDGTTTGMNSMGGTASGMTSGAASGRARVPGYNSFGIPVGTSGTPMSSSNGPGSGLGSSGGMSSFGGATAGMSGMGGATAGMSGMGGTTAGMSGMGGSMGMSAMDGTTAGMSGMGGTTAGMGSQFGASRPYQTANYRGNQPGHDAYLRSDSQSPNESAYQSQGQQGFGG